MNNDQFRSLLGADTPRAAVNSTDQNGAAPSASRAFALGSKQRSSIPMTPRSIGLSQLSAFQRQLTERNQAQKKEKKYKSAAPKGSKLAEGYTDRTTAREAQEEDDKAVRIKALEEAYKKEEIDRPIFERVRSEIAGGDLSSTHLIKGLDFKLLERVRRGENVWDGSVPSDNKDVEEDEEQKEEDQVPGDVDDALAELEQAKVDVLEKEKTVKKGQLATSALKPGQKRSRDVILAQMKAAREAAKAREESRLGPRFKTVGARRSDSRIERDSKGREVLIIVDEDGNEKRKVRKFDPEMQRLEEAKAREDMMPDKDAKPLGMEVPDAYKPKLGEAEDEDMDIFEGVGADYDPLAGLDEESDESDESDETRTEKASRDGQDSRHDREEKEKLDRAAMPPPPYPVQSTTEGRNYFKDSKSSLVSSETLKAPSLSDPAIQAALKKAASLHAASRADEEGEEDEENRAKAERRRRMLQNDDRDAADLDMGFGTSRFEDEEDFEDVGKDKLSQWGSNGDDGDGAKGGGGGKQKRKRGGGKRKADGNNAADVLRIIEQRKSTAGK